jgi:hypothetical protein
MCLLLLGAAGSIVAAFFAHPGRWLSSAGLMLDIGGIIQLELSGAFEKLFERYSDLEQYPGGPPSRITRQIIDDPDSPVRTWMRNTLFFEHGTGLNFLIAGFVFQLLGVWLWN